MGPPGCGKSAIVREAADDLRLDLVDVRATLLDPADLRGLPRVSDDSAVWCPPAFLPKGGAGLLFLDELAQAAPLVQAACLQLLLDRRVGEYELPAGWSVVAASNRAEDRAGTHRLISPLLNRFVHLDLEVSADDWHSILGSTASNADCTFVGSQGIAGAGGSGPGRAGVLLNDASATAV